MATAARLTLAVRRYQVARFTIRIAGIDLSERDVAFEARPNADVPGSPLIRLNRVETAAAEGIKVEVETENGQPVTYLKGRFNKTTMSGDPPTFPYEGELGEPTLVKFGIVIADGAATIESGGDATERFYGDLVVEASAFGSNDAALNRPAGLGSMRGRASSGAASVTFGDQIVAVSIEGADLIAPLAERARSDADRAEDAADVAAEAANAVAPFTAALSSYYIEPINFQQGNLSATDGSVVASGADWKQAILPAEPGERFFYSGTITGGNAAVAVFYESSGTFLSAQYLGADGRTDTYKELEIIAPPGTGLIGPSGYKFDADGNFSPTLLKRFSSLGGTALVSVDDLEKSLSVFQDDTIVETTGFYFWPNGSVNTDGNHRHVRVATRPGEKLYYSGVVASGAYAAAIYFDATGNHIEHAERFVGADGQVVQYVDQEIETPAGAFYAGFSTRAFDADGFSVSIEVKRTKIMRDAAQQIRGIQSETSYWAGKKIVWLGTSIPETGYPLMVGGQIGADVTNEALGSSSARFGVAQNRNVVAGDIYGLSGLSWFLASRSLAKTSAEAEDLIENWATYREFFDPASNPPLTLSLGEADQIRDSSFEVKFARNADADLWVFDHGYNDHFANRFGTGAGATSGGNGDMLYLPTDNYDQGTYLGAMNFLLRYILEEINPRARIAFIGHYENGRDSNIAQGQEALAKAWGYPLIKLWEKMGWGNQTITTTGYWTSPTNWVPSGGPGQNLLLTQVNMEDNLHPYSTATQQFIADNIAPEIRLIR